jgi:hypothetical protein
VRDPSSAEVARPSLLRVASLVGALACGWLAGCGDDSKFATLTVELAALSTVAAETGENECGVTRETALPAEVTCLAFSLCRRTDEGCEPVGLLRSGARGGGVRVLRVPRSAVVSFDTSATGGPFELTVTGYDVNGEVFATATTRGFSIGAPVRVRLERQAAESDWSCAPGTASGAVQPRALHAATLLPNGEVLLYGGVFGDAIDATIMSSGTQGATLQPTVEVYDAVAQRVAPVRVTGSYDWGGRVLFASRLLPGPAAGPYTIALYGGYEASAGAVLFLDEIQSENAVGSPLVPSADAVPGPALRLTYDPQARRVAIEPLPLGDDDAVATGFVALSEDLDGSTTALLALGAGAFTGPMRIPDLSSARAAFRVGSNGAIPMPRASVTWTTARLAASATAIDDERVFVWGGVVDEMMNGNARLRAGELLGSTGDTAVLRGGVDTECPSAAVGPSPEGLPPPTAFHTATRIAVGEVLLAGGLLVSGTADCAGRGITGLAPSARPLSVVSFDAAGNAAGVGVTAPADFRASVFHTATATARGVVLVGGAAERDGMRLEGLTQVGIVTRSGPGVYGFEALPELVTPRFGHAATLLPGERLLVTGGFERVTGARRVRAVNFAEVLPLAARPAPALACSDEPLAMRDAGAGDAGRRDGAVADAGADDAATDASADDAGP